jgi:hypothetical protein
MAKIPAKLHEPISKAFPANVCLVGTVLPNGYAQVSPRGSVLVFDDEHLMLWERGKGSTTENMHDGSKVTVFFRDPKLRESGVLPAGGVARFYCTAKIHKTGPIVDQVWAKLIQPEKDRDAEKKGFAVLLAVDKVEDLGGKPIAA